jgi:murein DD-endopeptidase MepM/ murein hydrolase activator NlpD
VEISETPPIEILFSGITQIDTRASVLLRINAGDASELKSSCSDTKNILKEESDKTIIQWRLKDTCTIPLISYKGVNYIIPINGALPQKEALSDISSETLRNTLRASTIIKNDYRLSSLRLREFFSNIETILRARETKFILPISGSPLPTNPSHLPNASRPFRADTTDGVHHGWDFYVNEGTPVRAIEDGTIMHVKRDFTWSEMEHLHHGDSELELQENLDVYRGNTVYLKTVSGHVAIYAHLSDIPSDIQVGKKVSQGYIVGHVGDSAVPDKKYLYHLHFELAMNPLKDSKAGSYTFEDVLLWPFWWKGKSMTWVGANDDYLFE